MRADLLDRSENQYTIIGTQFERRIVHEAAYYCQSDVVWSKHGTARDVMIPVYGAGFGSVQSRSVAGKGQEVSSRLSHES